MKRNGALLFSSAAIVALLSVIASAQMPGHFGATRAPAIEVDKKNRIYITMSVATKPAGAGTPGSQIFFTMSKDGGLSWNNLPLTRNLSKSRGEAFGPSMALNGNKKPRVYVVYHDNSTGNTQAYMIKSKKVAKFKASRNITPGDQGAFTPRVALDSNEAISIVWGDTTGGGRRVVYVRSTDQGETFTEPLDISRSPGLAFEPELDVDSTGAINVAWEDTAMGESAIMFSRSTDGGQSFSQPLRVSTGAGRATEAHIRVDSSDNIHVVWVDESEGDAQAFYSRSTDGGLTFSDPINLSNRPGREIHKPFLATDGARIFVAYHEEAGGNRQVYLVRSTDGGLSFSNPVQVSQANTSNGRAHSPAMIVDGKGTLHIIWIDTSIVGNDEGLLFYRNTRNGTSFSQQQLILAALP
ncbi:MAG TPA: exo-alpha-sialidase [Blastocatellia bacterium]|nr:exo-alpha-sialidase [Blastocatellia bacterium]